MQSWEPWKNALMVAPFTRSDRIAVVCVGHLENDQSVFLQQLIV